MEKELKVWTSVVSRGFVCLGDLDATSLKVESCQRTALLWRKQQGLRANQPLSKGGNQGLFSLEVSLNRKDSPESLLPQGRAWHSHYLCEFKLAVSDSNHKVSLEQNKNPQLKIPMVPFSIALLRICSHSHHEWAGLGAVELQRIKPLPEMPVPLYLAFSLASAFDLAVYWSAWKGEVDNSSTWVPATHLGDPNGGPGLKLSHPHWCNFGGKTDGKLIVCLHHMLLLRLSGK